MTHNDTNTSTGSGRVPHFITLNAASDRSGIPLSSLRREVAEGRGPTPIKIGGRLYFESGNFEEWIENIRKGGANNA
jgi:predicted DNA-binding transcriptional regulator AlpA